MTLCVISPTVSRDSARKLAELLGANYHAAEHPDFSMYDTVINYGSSRDFLFKSVINHPAAVEICVNKISTLKRIDKFCNTIQWTKDKKLAQEWFDKDGVVVARAKETGSQNDGMTICETENQFKTAPAKFYTKYFYHSHEIRVNVFKNKVISVFEKKRNKDGTWDFQHIPVKGIVKPVEQMIEAIKNNIGIDMYGMDILINKKGDYRLLEVNTGPILHEETEQPLIKELKKELK